MISSANATIKNCFTNHRRLDASHRGYATLRGEFYRQQEPAIHFLPGAGCVRKQDGMQAQGLGRSDIGFTVIEKKNLRRMGPKREQASAIYLGFGLAYASVAGAS